MAKRKKKAAGAAINTGAYEYVTLRVRGKDGKIIYSRGNADAVAKAMLLDASLGGTTARIIKDNKLKISASGNAGTVRMSVGVALRGLINNGTAVTIGKLTVKSLKQKVDLPKVEPLAGSAPRRKKAKTAKTAKKARKASAPRKPRAKKATSSDAVMAAEREADSSAE